MNRLGIQSLNAGAPDLRLSGDQTQRGTYTQRRRNQMAYGGIAGLDGRMKYGIGSWFQEKIKDPIKEKVVDPLIDLVTDNPMASTLVGGALLNQFGIPFTGTPGDRMGQNWLGNLLGGVTGNPVDTVLNPSQWFTGGISGMDDAGLSETWREDLLKQATQEGLTGAALDQVKRIAAGNAPGILGLGQYGGSLTGTVADQFNKYVAGLGGQGTTPDASGRYPIRWKEPLAIGSAIGAADYLTRSDDTMPAQLAIDPARFATAEAAKADPNLRFKPQEAYTLKDGGRIGFTAGGGSHEKWIQRNRLREIEKNLPRSRRAPPIISPHTSREGIEAVIGRYREAVQKLRDKYGWGWREKREELADEGINMADVLYGDEYAQGGRIGYYGGGIGSLEAGAPDIKYEGDMRMASSDMGDPQENADWHAMRMFGKPYKELLPEELELFDLEMERLNSKFFAQGGRVAAQEGGLMDLGGMEKDYRQEGGFVPIGAREKADDVPARLSKNEFVFTADAVRNAGGGDIDEGAAVMERLMENLEAGGKVSEESQGLEGAQAMFANTQRLQNRII